MAALVAGTIFGAAAAAAPERAVPVEAVHDLLKAEFATQRGDLDTALTIYTALARAYRDPAVARRAVEVAIRGRNFGAAIDASALMLELEPDSTLAREMLASLITNEAGGLDGAQATIKRLIDRSGEPTALLMQLSHLFGKVPDKKAVLAATQALVAPHASTVEARYAVAVAHLVAGDNAAAIAQSEGLLADREGWEPAAVLHAQALRKESPARVIPFYQAFVAQFPGSRDVREQLGRELAGERKLAEARAQFIEVEALTPKDGQASYAVGLLSLQLDDHAGAQGAFQRALDRGYRDASAVHLGLGAAAEGQKKYDEAIGWYKRVESADWMRAQLKIATLVTRQQGLAAGREYLQNLQPRTPEDRVQRVQVEAQLLREAKSWQATFDVLDTGVRDNPDSFELLYDRAMAAERLGKLEVAEADLRRVIRMKPDYAHAYNALGYTLAEKTERLVEAKVLIEQAIKLSPQDPFIQDSLGWVHYRLGNHVEAIRVLQAAYSVRPDPEIAAHLGEVLWKSGQKDEARRVWRAALTENPDHESLIAVMRKFKP